ncbi:tetratricopeptide (TPR) repeat protein [Bradyrhizobium japonicum]|uniref:tetratricopeptide repeat protein n=1 Tax=Bradyrhizobium japonicum TaxID=375 RepID=UPI002227DCC2|nr:tetratricopeptide repeat protein [Bradyrhizobium japonicum]MCW2217441.1 tetratricopeptide (TPR) repeat protein [Bradyrhizobium japonicum]MCW2342055.1 tetratricopeptide (TPR) repeat protein [Bradyrhizobium japonicum]
MANLIIRIVTLATCSIVLIAAFSVTPVVAAPGTEPGGSEADYGGMGQRSAYPPSSYPKRSGNKATHTPKAKKAKQSLFDDPAFAHGYRAAYSAVYDRTDYASAIEQLKTLGHDDHPNVANLIGYSYRKLGDYEQSQVWYERALKADPNHVLTWQYYGLWQLERGNREQALYHLGRIASICGTGCEEYRSLAAALEKPPGTSLVY